MKEVKDMTIAEVLQTQVFAKEMSAELSHIGALLRSRKTLKRNEVDRLAEKNLLNTSEMTVLFAQVLDRKCELSSNERRCVLYIGMAAYQRTMKKLLEDEKAGNERNGDNKQ